MSVLACLNISLLYVVCVIRNAYNVAFAQDHGLVPDHDWHTASCRETIVVAWNKVTRNAKTTDHDSQVVLMLQFWCTLPFILAVYSSQ